MLQLGADAVVSSFDVIKKTSALDHLSYLALGVHDDCVPASGDFGQRIGELTTRRVHRNLS